MKTKGFLEPAKIDKFENFKVLQLPRKLSKSIEFLEINALHLS